jgi:hypothetical protein
VYRVGQPLITVGRGKKHTRLQGARGRLPVLACTESDHLKFSTIRRGSMLPENLDNGNVLAVVILIVVLAFVFWGSTKGGKKK